MNERLCCYYVKVFFLWPLKNWKCDSGAVKNAFPAESVCVKEAFVCADLCRTAEERLTLKPPGYFLIRVSESRVGYTLSYRWVFTALLCRLTKRSKSSLCCVGLPQWRRTLQTLYDWCPGGRPVHHIRGEQDSQESAGPGGLSLPESHHAFQSGAHSCLWKGKNISVSSSWYGFASSKFIWFWWILQKKKIANNCVQVELSPEVNQCLLCLILF